MIELIKSGISIIRAKRFFVVVVVVVVLGILDLYQSISMCAPQTCVSDFMDQEFYLEIVILR